MVKQQCGKREATLSAMAGAGARPVGSYRRQGSRGTTRLRAVDQLQGVQALPRQSGHRLRSARSGRINPKIDKPYAKATINSFLHAEKDCRDRTFWWLSCRNLVCTVRSDM
jgi:hypothetical protein